MIHTTQVPKNDGHAVEYLWNVYDFGDDWLPAYVEREASDGTWVLLPFKLDYGEKNPLFYQIVAVKE